MSGSFFGKSGGGLAGSLPTGVKMAAAAVLLHQLMKHARGAEGGSAPAARPGGEAGGGLGGLLGGLLGGGTSVSGGSGSGLGGLLAGGGGLGALLGGLGGMLGGLREKGLGQQVDSWVAPGPNRPVTPQEIAATLDPQELDEAARRAGTDRDSLLNELSRLLPQFVDRATPRGAVPQREEDLGGGGLGGLLGGLLGGDTDGRQSGAGTGPAGPRTRG